MGVQYWRVCGEEGRGEEIHTHGPVEVIMHALGCTRCGAKSLVDAAVECDQSNTSMNTDRHITHK